MKFILSVKLCDKVNLRDGVKKKLKHRFVAKVQVAKLDAALALILTRLNVARNRFRIWETVRNVHLHVYDLACSVSELSLWSHGTNLTDEKRKKIRGSREER